MWIGPLLGIAAGIYLGREDVAFTFMGAGDSHDEIVALRDAGCAILLVSAELEEVTALSDRLLVVHNGEVVGEVDPKVATTEEIGLMMTGGHG